MATEMERLGKEADKHKLDMRHSAHKDYIASNTTTRKERPLGQMDRPRRQVLHLGGASVHEDGQLGRPAINARDCDGKPPLLTTNSQTSEEFFNTFLLPPDPPTELPDGTHLPDSTFAQSRTGRWTRP